MNKVITSFIFIIFLIVIFTYNIYKSKENVYNFLSINNDILKLIVINKDVDLFLSKDSNKHNFDYIKNKINEFNEIKNKIYGNEILKSIKNEDLQHSLVVLNRTIYEKFHFVDYYKSYRAILNNSYNIIRRIQKNGISLAYSNLYVQIMSINTNDISDFDDIEQFEKQIENLLKNYNIKNDKLFLMHAEVILEHQIKAAEIKEELFNMDLNNKLNNFQKLYELNSKDEIDKENVYIVSLIIIVLFLVLVYLIYEYKLEIVNTNLQKFRLTLENSDNIIMITDKDKYIKYVNKVFTKVTGYTKKEAIGNKADFMKSNKHTSEFYKNLHSNLKSGKKWNGEFINKHKDGSDIYERATITPVFDKDGNVYEYISIKLDITNEVLARKKLKEKEKMLNHQSKMASMGGMLENISHQWRQPLSLISTTATGMIFEKERKKEYDDIKKLTTINNTIQYLSQTITDFKDFFNPNKEKIKFNLKNVYQKTYNIIAPKLNSLNIKMIENIHDVELFNLDTEVMQVIINILNNAKDALESIDIDEKLIFIEIYKDNETAVITIKDNAGGIPKDIIDNIFDPYFTTKHKTQGTGIGLYMSQEIISKHMKGTLTVHNIEYEYKNNLYNGAKFIIRLPIKC